MGLCLGPHGDPMGWAVSYERGTPVRHFQGYSDPVLGVVTPFCQLLVRIAHVSRFFFSKKCHLIEVGRALGGSQVPAPSAKHEFKIKRIAYLEIMFQKAHIPTYFFQILLK